MPRYTWIDGPPRYWGLWMILFYATIAQFAVCWILEITISFWGQSFTDSTHTVPLRMKGGQTWYLSPTLGWYLNNYLWIYFGLAGILLFFVLIHRKKLRRVD